MVRDRLFETSVWYWRALTYRNLLFGERHPRAVWRVATRATRALAVRCARNRSIIELAMQHWERQTSALFAPDRTPFSHYAGAFVPGSIALDTFATPSERGTLIFATHGAFLLQNLSCLVASLAKKSTSPCVDVLMFRRQHYPHVESWWLDYTLAFNVNLTIVHDNGGAFLQKSKHFLRRGEIVIVLPDYFFSTGVDFAKAHDMFLRAAKNFMRIAKNTESDVLYVDCCALAQHDNFRSFVTSIHGYDAAGVSRRVMRDIRRAPECWFFTINHWREFAKKGDRRGNHYQSA